MAALSNFSVTHTPPLPTVPTLYGLKTQVLKSAAWIQVLTPTLTSHMTLGYKLFDLIVPLFAHTENETILVNGFLKIKRDKPCEKLITVFIHTKCSLHVTVIIFNTAAIICPPPSFPTAFHLSSGSQQ